MIEDFRREMAGSMRTQSLLRIASIIALLFGVLSFGASAGGAETNAASSIPPGDLLQPATLAATLQSDSAVRPLVLQVGFRKLFDEAHIIAAEYAGPGGASVGLASLRERVAKLPKDSAIVIYCGCCPWEHCPNIGAAFSELRLLGFRNVKALYITHDFGTDWIEKGYPVTKGG
jgi:thiosulfate/3-mercaptopyruvate sulfurtransferase